MAWFSKNGWNPNNWGRGYRCGVDRKTGLSWASATKSAPPPDFKVTIFPRKIDTRLCLLKNGKYAKSQALTNEQIKIVNKDKDNIDWECTMTPNGSIVKVYIKNKLLFIYDETKLSVRIIHFTHLKILDFVLFLFYIIDKWFQMMEILQVNHQ